MIKNISNQVIPLYIQSEDCFQRNLKSGESLELTDLSIILNLKHLLDPAIGLIDIREGVN